MPRSDALKALIGQRRTNYRPGKPRKRARKPKRWLPPDSVAREYTRALWGQVGEMNQAIEEEFLPFLPDLVEQANLLRPDRADNVIDWAEKVAQLIVKTKTGYKKKRKADPEGLARVFAQQASDWNDKEFKAVVKSAIGVDPFVREPWLGVQLGGFVRQNVDLIKSLPDKHFSDIEGIVLRGLADGRRHEEIAKEIRDRFQVPMNRASLIARDQISKLNGQLTRLRQTSLGIERYTWSTSRDERVRDRHRPREGKIFRWDEPPEDGHPGQPIGCRCTGEPVFDDLLEGIEEEKLLAAATGGGGGTGAGAGGGNTSGPDLDEEIRRAEQFAETVDLPGITAEELAGLNDGLEEVLGSQATTKLDHVGWIRQRGVRAKGEYTYPVGGVPPGTDYIEFKKGFVKDPIIYSARDRANFEAKKRRHVRDLLQGINNPDTPESGRMILEARLRLWRKTKRWDVASDSDNPIMAVAAHEAGHAVYFQDLELKGRWLDALQRNGVADEIIEISEYAGWDEDELFAEVTTAFATGRSNIVPDSIKRAYNETLRGWRRRY